MLQQFGQNEIPAGLITADRQKMLLPDTGFDIRQIRKKLFRKRCAFRRNSHFNGSCGRTVLGAQSIDVSVQHQLPGFNDPDAVADLLNVRQDVRADNDGSSDETVGNLQVTCDPGCQT